MYKFLLSTVLIFAVISPVSATVYEFDDDGSMMKHEAFDYRSTHGRQTFEVFIPTVLTTPAAFLNTYQDHDYEELIQNAALAYGLSPSLIRAVIKVESAGRRNALSSKGAQGLMQLMPATAQQYGVIDPFDPIENINAGSKYLKYLLNRYDQDTHLALAAYNAGEGTVDRYKGIPPYPETVAYVGKISALLE